MSEPIPASPMSLLSRQILSTSGCGKRPGFFATNALPALSAAHCTNRAPSSMHVMSLEPGATYAQQCTDGHVRRHDSSISEDVATQIQNLDSKQSLQLPASSFSKSVVCISTCMLESSLEDAVANQLKMVTKPGSPMSHLDNRSTCQQGRNVEPLWTITECKRT